MSEIERKPFEIKVGERNLALELGTCACVLFRTKQEVDYLAVSIEEDGQEDVLRIFDNTDLVRWMAGLVLEGDGWHNTTMNGERFRDVYNWSPATLIKEQPNAEEEEWYLDVQTQRLEKDLEEFGNES